MDSNIYPGYNRAMDTGIVADCSSGSGIFKATVDSACHMALGHQHGYMLLSRFWVSPQPSVSIGAIDINPGHGVRAMDTKRSPWQQLRPTQHGPGVKHAPQISLLFTVPTSPDLPVSNRPEPFFLSHLYPTIHLFTTKALNYLWPLLPTQGRQPQVSM